MLNYFRKVITECEDDLDYLESDKCNVIVESYDNSNEAKLKNESRAAKDKDSPLFTSTKVLKLGGPAGSLREKSEINPKKGTNVKKTSIKCQKLITELSISKISSSVCFSQSSDSHHKRPPESAAQFGLVGSESNFEGTPEVKR